MPKELVLHLTATITVVLSLIGVRQLSLTRVDTLLIGYLGVSAISALFAPNWWLAERALAITYSGIALFWVARALAHDGLATQLSIGLIVAIVVGAATALAQAYGVTSDYMSLNRAPGGTLGNRNFMAHLVVIGSPLVVLYLSRARRLGVVIGGLVVAALSATLVLSRSRAAWLAMLVCVVLSGPVVWHMVRDARRNAEPTARQGRKRWRVLGFAAIVGIVAALAIPNTLEWRSDSPYLDSVRGVVNYKEGSGHGRLIQYQHSIRMAAAHPLLGVGPGNWPVVYPKIVPADDPSLNQGSGMTANPWPSSDWIALIAERGVVASVLFILAMVGLCVGAWHQWREATHINDRAAALALVATLLVTSIVGMFDAVLLIAISSLFVWSILGILSPPAKIQKTIMLSGRSHAWLVTAVIVVGCLFTIRSAGQIAAMSMYNGARRTALVQALQFDPGNYRIRMQLATLEAHRGSCTQVSVQAGAAHKLFPSARAPMRLLRQCR